MNTIRKMSELRCCALGVYLGHFIIISIIDFIHGALYKRVMRNHTNPNNKLQPPATNIPDKKRNFGPNAGRIFPKIGDVRNTTKA